MGCHYCVLSSVIFSTPVNVPPTSKRDVGGSTSVIENELTPLLGSENLAVYMYFIYPWLVYLWV